MNLKEEYPLGTMVRHKTSRVIREGLIVGYSYDRNIKRMLYNEELELLVDCVVILVIKDNKTLLGIRSDGQGWSSAGGAVEYGESVVEAAERELLEEFGLEAIELEYKGRFWGKSLLKGKKKIITYPSVFICSNFNGEPPEGNAEMLEIKWFNIRDIDSVNMFVATREFYRKIVGI